MGGGEGRKGSGWSGLAGWGTGRGDDGHTQDVERNRVEHLDIKEGP